MIIIMLLHNRRFAELQIHRIAESQIRKIAEVQSHR